MVELFKVFMPHEVDAPLLETLHSGYITEGPKVKEFEAKFAKFIGLPHTVAVNSGTSALTLALRVAGVGPGDEVVTTPMTCSATNLPILSLGATPVWADVNPTTGLIDVDDALSKVTKKTKVIMAVDWGGQPVDVFGLQAAGVKVIVDAAHSLGVSHNATPDFACYSLQAIKHITTVDGGVLVCKAEADFKQAKTLRWFGIDREAPAKDTRIDIDIADWGYKFHMNDVAATIGLVQLDHAQEVIDAQRSNAAYYQTNLVGYYGRPLDPGSAWLYTLTLPYPDHRESFKAKMADHGIQVSQVHRRNDEYSVFAPFKAKLPGLDIFSSTMICIPVNWSLTKPDLSRVVTVCNEFGGLAWL